MALQRLLRAFGLSSEGGSRPQIAKSEDCNEDAAGFRQSGVEVSYARRNVRLGTSYLPVGAISGIDWESSRVQGSPFPWTTQERGKVIITTSSVTHPKHEVGFKQSGAQEDARQFAQRFKSAIEKAGGASFP